MSNENDRGQRERGERENILCAAELLVAEHGFDLVSAGEVAGAAGVPVDRVFCQFGSREGLMEALLERYIRPINLERLRLLDALEQECGEKPPPLEGVLEAYMRPMLERLERHGMPEAMYFKMLGRCMGERSYHLPESLMPVFGQVSGRFAHVLRRILPNLTEEVIIWRMHFVFGAVAHTLMQGESLHRLTLGRSGEPNPEVVLRRLIGFCTGGLRGPAGEASPADDWVATDLC